MSYRSPSAALATSYGSPSTDATEARQMPMSYGSPLAGASIAGSVTEGWVFTKSCDRRKKEGEEEENEDREERKRGRDSQREGASVLCADVLVKLV